MITDEPFMFLFLPKSFLYINPNAVRKFSNAVVWSLGISWERNKVDARDIAGLFIHFIFDNKLYFDLSRSRQSWVTH